MKQEYYEREKAREREERKGEDIGLEGRLKKCSEKWRVGVMEVGLEEELLKVKRELTIHMAIVNYLRKY